MSPNQTDVVVLGAGAAGLMCAAEAGKRGRRVLVLDHARNPAEKIRISGGGRCNFTNVYASPEHYLSQNPRFCISALSRYTPQDFISLVEKYRIAYHEKTLGQLFCDDSSHQIIRMLLAECSAAKVEIWLETKVDQLSTSGGRFLVTAGTTAISCESLVVACGGLSIPKMGATDFGYKVARQFGIGLVPTLPGLVPFTLSETQLRQWQSLAGVSLQAEVQCGKTCFREGLLFTHRGLSGPAILQISSYWRPGTTLRMNLAPECDVARTLANAKLTNPRQEVANVLGTLLPKRLAQQIRAQHFPGSGPVRLGDTPDRQLVLVGSAVNEWHMQPQGTEGYRTAEVTLGGVDTTELSSKTMETRKVPGLYFIGEVVDVTGHLGGFNFQWAWASGYVAGQYA